MITSWVQKVTRSGRFRTQLTIMGSMG